MNWVDIVLALGGWVLNFSALSTLLSSKAVVPYTHSVPVVFCVLAYVFAYAELGLTQAAISSVAGLLVWVGIVLVRGPRKAERD